MYRRLVTEDDKGVREGLDETVCVVDKCEGLTVSIYQMTLYSPTGILILIIA